LFLVSGDGRIDLFSPFVDTAKEAFNFFETGLFEEFNSLCASPTDMAIDNNFT
jgi:hypothetical protein